VTPANNTNGVHRARVGPAFVALACITLTLASWGYYELLTGYAGMPSGLAIFAVAGLDVAAIALGKHALTVAADGDSSAVWNLGLLGLVGVGAWAQFEHARLAGDALVIGVVSAVFPIVTVALFEGQLRRVYRLRGRRAGRVAEPRATQDLITWLLYPGLAYRATKIGVLDRGLSPDDALAVAQGQRALEAAAAEAPAPRRRGLTRTYAAEMAAGLEDRGSRADDGAPVPVTRVHVPPVPDSPDGDPGKGDRTPDNVPDDWAARGYDGSEADRPELWPDDAAEPPLRAVPTGTMAGAVRAAMGRHGDDLDRVVEDVRRLFPGADRDTVRRQVNRERGRRAG
jgi:hypothetical protein